MKETLAAIKEELKTLRKERLCSEHSAAQHYWRGYRDGLTQARNMILNELDKQKGVL